jgi:hypothetical protein
MAAIRVSSYGGGESGGTAAQCGGGLAIPGDGEVRHGAREHRGNMAKSNLGFSRQRREAERAGRAHSCCWHSLAYTNYSASAQRPM